MSNAPYLLPKARTGYRMGTGEIIDHMMRDGLQSPFDGKSMGCFADSTASKYSFSRAQQDAFATESVRRAMAALEGGEFDGEVTPVTVKGRKGETVIARDETPGTCDVSKITTMKPAFNKDGTVTAASSSSISDGAAALVLMNAKTAAARGLKPLARVVAYASHAQEPEWFTTAPVGAIRKVLSQLGWKPHDADLYEINEAFAVVTMAAMRDIDIDHARVNVNWAAPAPSAIRSAPPARAFSRPWCTRCAGAAASAAWPRCASAVARRWRSPSRSSRPGRRRLHEDPGSTRRRHRRRLGTRPRGRPVHRRARRQGGDARRAGRPRAGCGRRARRQRELRALRRHLGGRGRRGHGRRARRAQGG